MSFLNVFVILVGVISLILGYFILSRGSKSKATLSLASIAFITGIWAFALLMYYLEVFFSGFEWIKIVYVIVFFMVINVFHFSFIFPYNTRKSIFSPVLIYLLISLPLLYILFFTDLWIKEVISKPWGPETILGPAYSFVIFFWGCFGVWSIYNLFKKYLSSTGINRARIKYILLGFTLFIIVIATIPGIIPVITGSTRYFQIAPLSSLFFVGFTTYAILRYRLMDIRLVIKRGFVYFLSIIIFLAIFLTVFIGLNKYFLGESIASSRIILGSILFGLGLIFFNQILKFFEKLANKYLFKTLYTSKQAIEELTKKTTTIIELPKLIEAISETVMKAMGLNRAGVLLFDPKTDNYQVSKVIGFTEANGVSLVRSNYLTQKLSQAKKPIILQELEMMASQMVNGREKADLEKLRANMKRIEASLCLPLISKHRLLGIIVLGEKISNEAYTKEDLELLQTLASQAAVAVENAQLYQEVQNFSKTLKEKVDEQTKDLKELLRMKSEFLTVASHQLRTPVSIVRGYLSMIHEGDVKGKQKEDFIDKAFIASNAMERVVHELLTITEMEAGGIKITNKPTDIEPLIAEITEARQKIAEEKSLTLTFQPPKTKLPLVMIDSTKMDDVVGNLIDNAIHYTVKGGVTVSVGQEGKLVKVDVKDTGIGFSAEDKKIFFQKFSRSKEALKTNPNGTGMGLYVAKLLVDQMKGRIDATSPGQGKGSTFSVWLPIS